jgi:branched-chain amino acid transport system substrate-binding protein
MLGVEAIRTTQAKFGKTADRIKHLGFEGVLRPIKMSCADHEGARTARIQTWDGKSWKITSDWYVSDDSVIAPMVHRGRREPSVQLVGAALRVAA